MVIEVPEELKTLGEAMQALVAKVVAANRSVSDGRAVDYAPLERDVGALCAGIEGHAHGALLQALDIDVDRVWIDGKEWVKVERCPGTYYTKAGPTSATRSLYRQVGVRNGKTIDPISLRAGVIGDGWLPDTAQVMAFLHQQSTSREAAASAAKLGRAAYSRSSFETVAHLVGAAYEPRRKDIEDALISRYSPPREAKSVSVSLDRVSLPMEEPRPRPPGRPRKGAPKRPIARNFRMAYCGTVTLHDAEGAALHTIRYGCMPGGNPADLVAGMAGDVAKLLEKNPALLVAALNDGAHELWNLMAVDIKEEVLGVKVYHLVDLWHLLEKLGKAARLVYGAEGVQAAVRRWRLALLNRSDAAKDIIWELWRSGRRHARTDEGRPVHEAIRYLLNHRERMNYAGARRKGLPVGSGNVEATCKTLVEVRMKRAGSRWKEETGNHVLQLRALALSDRWDQAATLALAPLRKAVRAAA
jgi:hypothetical protein